MDRYVDDLGIVIAISSTLKDIIISKKMYVHLFVLAGGVTLLYKAAKVHDKSKEFMDMAQRIREVCWKAYSSPSGIEQIPIHSLEKEKRGHLCPRMRASTPFPYQGSLCMNGYNAPNAASTFKQSLVQAGIQYPELVYCICQNVVEKLQSDPIIKERDLCEDEVYALTLYTFDYTDYNSSLDFSNPFQIINSALALRDFNGMSQISGLLSFFMRGLRKLRVYTTHTLFMSCGKPNCALQQGSTYEWAVLGSASPSFDLIRRVKDAFKDEMLITISGLSWGYDISKFSLCPKEDPEIVVEPELPLTFVSSTAGSLNFVMEEGRAFLPSITPKSAPFHYSKKKTDTFSFCVHVFIIFTGSDYPALATCKTLEEIRSVAEFVRMFEQTENHDMIFVTLTALNSVLSLTTSEKWSVGVEFVRQGLIQPATNILSRYCCSGNESLVVQEVVRTICNFFAITAFNRDSYRAFTELDTIRILINAMQRYYKMPEICIPVLQTFERIASVTDGLTQTLATEEFRDLLVRVANECSSHCEVISLISHLLDNLLRRQEISKVFLSRDLIKAILNGLYFHVDDRFTIIFICGMLVNFGYSKDGEKLLVEEDVIPTLIKVLRINFDDKVITYCVLRPLVNILCTHEGASIAMKEGCIYHLLKVIEKLTSEDVEIALESFKCYVNIMNQGKLILYPFYHLLIQCISLRSYASLKGDTIQQRSSNHFRRPRHFQQEPRSV